MFGFGNKNKKVAEMAMSEWLAHPNEFGESPKSVRFKRTYKGELVSYGNVEIHLVDYEMPDGTIGRGFVNGNLTWSFLGNDVNKINDDDLLSAYCGWAWLFPAIQAGNILTDFESQGEESLFLSMKAQEGFENINITDRYKIGTSELFEFTATKQGKSFVGAGDSNGDVAFEEDDPYSSIPAIYFLLGGQVIQSMR